jgi:hypothetical protein
MSEGARMVTLFTGFSFRNLCVLCTECLFICLHISPLKRVEEFRLKSVLDVYTKLWLVQYNVYFTCGLIRSKQNRSSNKIEKKKILIS